MNKKIALVDLLQESILLTAEQKLRILDQLPMFNEKQVDALGKLLALEQRFIETHNDDIKANMNTIYETFLQKELPEPVYVGTGKATGYNA